MRLRHMSGHVIAFCAVTVLVIALAPAVVVFGEFVNRRYWRCRTGIYSYAGSPGASVWKGRARMSVVLNNPLWIALTAPARWLADHLRPRAGSGRRRGGNGGPDAGVREPRRPRPDLPAGAMALPEPRVFG